MKTIEDYLNDAAKELLDTNSFNETIELLWRNEDIHWGIKNIKEVVAKAMQEYAKQCCEEQKLQCAENGSVIVGNLLETKPHNKYFWNMKGNLFIEVDKE